MTNRFENLLGASERQSRELRLSMLVSIQPKTFAKWPRRICRVALVEVEDVCASGPRVAAEGQGFRTKDSYVCGGLPITRRCDRYNVEAGFSIKKKSVLGGLHHEYRLERVAA